MKRRLGLHRATSTKRDIMRARKYFESVRVVPTRAPDIMRIRATYVNPDVPLTLSQLNDLVLWHKTTSDHPMDDWDSTRYLQWGVSECSRDAFCMRQTLSLVFWWLLDS